MPYAITLKCYIKSSNSEEVSGNLLHAAFFNILAEGNEEISRKLHSEEGRKAFTISPLFYKEHMTFNHLFLDKSDSKTNEQRLKAGDQVWFRVTLLDDTVFPAFSLRFLENPNTKIRLGLVELLVKEVTVSGGKKDRWNGFSDYKKLYDTAQPLDEIILQFATPTSFKQGDTIMLFPLPDLIFKGYIEKWNKYSGIVINDSLLDKIKESFILSQYFLKTLPFLEGRAMTPGFIGQCKFKTKNRDKEFLKNVNLLADFSFFAGTGRKTTHGMGMTRRLISR
ncbi:CRISPR-associated endoribonuclease Cas6 [Methylacidiphilum caldifontis]|uniref:CRISPR-associated endoribonuclease Cas6 n=1 Tax=Methylacidiphilum caldifontis TaxID=2795386 RepID=A0A4Y8PB05_9BACT|nr:CRISPR-associated endoribonuclease Cas6 [Methylacidiphilum caldifontis]TFE67812.1 CRISPR-associated endoribonuclease Cas6 [Methylacidiphilum caldifontis]